MEKISRKEFVRLFVAFSSLAVVGEAGCSGDDAPADGSSSGGSSGGTSSTSSSGGSTSSSSGGSTTSSSSGGSTSSSGGTDSGAGDGGGDAGADSGGGGNACTTNKTYTENSGIQSGHPHTLMIPAADFAGNVDKTYPVTQSTPHTVTITAADFATLRSGGTVVVTTSKDANHTHKCTIKC